MFTPRTFSRKTLRIFSISFDKEGQPNIVEVAKGQKNLPAGFPVEKFLEQYRLWKQAMKSSDPEEKNSMTSLYADLREMHQAAGLNKGKGSVFASNEEMEIFGEFLEGLKGTRITNLPGAVFTRGSGAPVMANGPQTATVPRSPLDIRYDSEYGEFYRRSRDYANGKYTLPTEGAYVQEPRQGDKAIVIWNKDQNLIHSIIIDGDQYIGQNGAFRNKEGKTVVVTHDPASKRIGVSFSQPIMATPVPVAPAPARPAVGSPVMAQPVPSPLPPPIYTPGGRAAPVAAPLEDRDEKSFQEAMKGVSFTINGKEAKVLQIGHGAEGLRVQLQVGGTAMQQIQQTIVFKKENSTYRVSGNILDSYTVQDQVTGGKRTISLTLKSPTSDRVPAPAPAVPVAPAPAPRPTAPASDAPRPTAPARVERTAEQVLVGNKKFIVDNQKDIDGALSKVKDATLKSQLEGYLIDPTNENVRKFQDAIGYKPDGDFRDFTLAALIKWAGMDAPTRAPDRETSNGMRVLVEGDPKIGEILHIGQLHQLSVTSPDATIMSCLSPEGEKKVIKGQRQIYEYLMKLKPDAIFAEGIYELTDDEDKALFQLFAAATFIAFGKIQVLPMKEVQNIFSVFKVKNKEELQDRIMYMKGGGFVAGILSEKIKGAADVAKDLAAAKDIGLDLTTCMAAFKKMESLTDPTAIPESVKKVREKVALEKIKAYLEKNPGKKVVLVYGAEHNFSEEFSSVFPTGKQPKLQAIDMARHIDMKDEKGNPKGSILFELPVSYEWKTGAKAIYKGGLNQKGLPEGQGIAIHTDADGSKKYYVGEFSGDGSAYPVGEVTLMIVDKDGFTLGTAKGKMGKDGVFAEGVVMERSGKNSLIWKGGKWVDGPQETSNRGNDDLKKPGNPVGPVRDQLIKGGYTHDTASSSSKDGVTTDIYSKLGAKTFVIQHKEGKIISVKLDESTVSKKEITTAELEAWKDKLGDGIKWSNTGTEKDPKKIGEVEVKGFMNLIYSGSERSYTVIKDTLYVWEDESSTWMKSGLLEIRDGKIEKILPKIESIEERVKKMKKVTLTGLGDAYKDIVPEYDADKKAIFLKAPHIETPQGHIRNYFGISEELFLAGGMVETGTIAFVKGLYNVTITPIDGELIVKMEEVKPAPRTKLVDLTFAEQAAEATRLFQEYLDATEHNQVKLSTRIKRPDTALRWVDTKDNDFAVGIDIATGKSFAGTSRKWDKELTQFEQGLWDTIITFMNRAAKMKKQVPDTSDPYESIRKKLQDQLTAPAPAPTPAPAPASAPSVAAPASSAASVPARSPSPKPTAPAASGVRRDGDATNY